MLLTCSCCVVGQIISSDNLARVLQKMLTVGNLMNEGTYRGQASGFSLDSLLKMVHTKGMTSMPRASLQLLG